MFQHVTVSICGEIYARVYFILYCVYDVVVKKVHVRYLISMDEFLVPGCQQMANVTNAVDTLPKISIA